MALKYFSERNLKFLLCEVFDAESLTRSEYYQDHNQKTFSWWRITLWPSIQGSVTAAPV